MLICNIFPIHWSLQHHHTQDLQPLILSIYKNFKRAVVDAYVYNKFCRSRWVDLDIGQRWRGNHFTDINWWLPKDKLSVLKLISIDQIVTWVFNYLQHYLVCWAYKDNCKNIPSGILVTNLSRIGARRSDEWQAQGMSNQSSYNIELNSSKPEFCKIQAWRVLYIKTSFAMLLCWLSLPLSHAQFVKY